MTGIVGDHRTWDYRVFGLTLRSDRRLPYPLPASEPGGAADIDIRFARYPKIEAVPLAVVQGIRVFAPDLAEFSNDSGIRIRIAAGRHLTVDPPPDMGEGELQTLIFGSAFAVLCHQRGQPPLHAGAVAVGNGALAISGHSGAGKSTTIRALMGRGHRLLSDDQLMVDAESGLAQPSLPTSKLWLDAASRLGTTIDPVHRVLRDKEKFHAIAPPSFRDEAAPLSVIFLLAAASTLDQPTIRLMPQAEAIMALGQQIVRADLAAALGTQATSFHHISRLVVTIPVYRVLRPKNLDRMDGLLDLLLAVAAQHGAGPMPADRL